MPNELKQFLAMASSDRVHAGIFRGLGRPGLFSAKHSCCHFAKQEGGTFDW